MESPSFREGRIQLLFMHRGRRLGFEVKFTEAPRLTASMRAAKAELKLDHLWMLYPGEDSFPMEEGITAMPISGIRGEPAPSAS